jgi:hypothetical protein
MVVHGVEVVHHFLAHRLDAILLGTVVGEVERLGDFALADPLFQVEPVDREIDEVVELAASARSSASGPPYH